MERQTIVAEMIYGCREVPEHLKKLVEEYNLRKQIIYNLRSYPRYLDEEMDKLHDAMEVLVNA